MPASLVTSTRDYIAVLKMQEGRMRLWVREMEAGYSVQADRAEEVSTMLEGFFEK